MQRVLTDRELNRALLARQGLLERAGGDPLAWIERLVGLQAQVPRDPYVALWARLAGFDPRALSDALAQRLVVRAGTLRGTIHLHTAEDCLLISSLTGEVMRGIYRGLAKPELRGLDVDLLAAAARAMLTEAPRTRRELGRALAPGFPVIDEELAGLGATYLLPLVQIPPRGEWGGRGQATWALTEEWLGTALDGSATTDELVLRYLAAFGPATPADARTWSRLPGLREVFERLRPRLDVYRDERGRTLFDVPGGALPEASTPAPVRLLPEYDNVLLAHADRARVVGEVPAPPAGSLGWGGVLVDGFLRGWWRYRDEAIAFHPADLAEVAAEEADRLVAFLSA
jgi:hypothetical protein